MAAKAASTPSLEPGNSCAHTEHVGLGYLLLEGSKNVTTLIRSKVLIRPMEETTLPVKETVGPVNNKLSTGRHNAAGLWDPTKSLSVSCDSRYGDLHGRSTSEMDEQLGLPK